MSSSAYEVAVARLNEEFNIEAAEQGWDRLPASELEVLWERWLEGKL